MHRRYCPDGRPGPLTRGLISRYRELVLREGVPIGAVSAVH